MFAFRYYGFVLQRRVGYKLFTLLVGGLLCALLAVFVLNVAEEASKAKKGDLDSSAAPSSSSVGSRSFTGAYAYRMKDAKAQS